MLRSRIKPVLTLFAAGLVVLIISACDAESSKPTALIVSPPSGSQYTEGEEVAVQSASADATGVTRVELIVDDEVVRTNASPVPSGQSWLNLTQTWNATPGTHTIVVRAHNVTGAMSDSAAVTVRVQAAGAATPSASSAAAVSSSSASSAALSSASSESSSSASSAASSAPPSSSASASRVASAPECTNNAAFVADVTIPDGTSVNAGQVFNKTWRMANNGTCTWGAGYRLVLVAGEAMTTSTVIPVPVTAPGATVNLTVPMRAPAPPGSHTGQWRLRASNGSLFGESVSVKINVPAPPASPSPAASRSATPVSSSSSSAAPSATPAPATCSGSPTIQSFSVISPTINQASSTILEWGAVTNADAAYIEPGIGGVGTPGSVTIAPASTTTYTLTAHCGANRSTKQVTVTVSVLPTPAVSTTPGTPQTPLIVSSVQAEVLYQSHCSNPSPHDTLFIGYITTSAAGTVKYKWVTSDGQSTPVTDLVFERAETDSVVHSHSFSGSGWAQLQVIAPNAKNSNQASFSKPCGSPP